MSLVVSNINLYSIDSNEENIRKMKEDERYNFGSIQDTIIE